MSVLVSRITVCSESWRLYDIWQDALDARPMVYETIKAARLAYCKHRDNCPLCSPIVRNSDRPAPTTPLRGETV
jgi:hypothetical protein